MQKRDAEPPIGGECSGDLGERGSQVVEVVQRHEGDSHVGHVITKRQPDGVRDRDRMALGMGRGGPHAGHRGIKANDAMPRPGQDTAEPALTAAHVHCQVTRRWDEAQELR